jgi:aminoglycoside phosphotransferase family enzyme/predicted kinase
LETHISWVVLTGKYAYKIKKPVRLPFVDYSTLELRKHFCELELELNQELAPDIYLDVVKITGPACAPSINGTGEIIEYAVRMNEFEQADILTHRLENGSVTAPEIDRLAKLLADFQGRIPKSPANASFGSPALVLQEAEDNFSAFRSALDKGQENACVWHSLLSEQQRNQLDQLQDWMHAEFKRCENLLIQRHASGMIRRGHGDMHAENIVLFKGRIEIFDRIEFNQDFQWTDCINELAFAYMDLIHHGRSDLANRLLSDYLEQTADYNGLGVFRFYLVYRSMVRAKVDWIRQQQMSGSLGDSPDAIFQTPFLQLALKLSERPDCFLYITHGLSGSGKSTAAMICVETKGAIRLRSDVERDRVIKKHSDVEKYSANMRSKVYDAMLETADNILAAGFSVVVDATFLSRIEREKFGQLAKRVRARFGIIECSAPVIELERRIRQRHADASEATVAVLHEQIRNQEDLTQEELGYICTPNEVGLLNTK